MDKINGIVEKIIYKNPENYYTVLDIDQEGVLIPATGIIMSISEGEKISASGEWYEHPNYGRQFKIIDFSIEAPKDIDSIRHYLESGMLTGIGEKKAHDLIEHFGLQILDIIETQPERLSEVRGIGEKTARSIHKAYIDQREERDAIIELLKYGISTNTAYKLFQQYGGNVVQVITNDPYRLIGEFSGIGFVKADAIAMNVGIESDSAVRIIAGIRYCIMLSIQKGYSYIPENILIRETSRILSVTAYKIEDEIASLYNSGKIILDEFSEERRCYLPFLYECEEESAKKLLSISSEIADIQTVDIEEYINKYQTYTAIELDDIQKKAILSAITKKVSVITGGPGTGKTTIIKAIINILSLLGKQFTLAAPTGRAAKKITETCGYEAKTIHRLLEYGYNPYTSERNSYAEQSVLFNRDQDNPLEEDFIIIDEMSMIDLPLMYHLLSAVKESSSLIFVGDADQLPSVGPGNVLSDMIESTTIPTVKLETVFRQTDESPIVLNAHRINQGKLPIINKDEKDFVFVDAVTQQKIASKLLRMITMNSYGSLDKLKEDTLQIISPFKNGDAGVINLNKQLQVILNPPSDEKHEVIVPNYTLREGDKIMQTKNNYTIEWKNIRTFQKGEGVFNGDMGTVSSIDPVNRQVTILFEKERAVLYSFNELACLTLAYAITIHKSQGSEFNTVIIPIYSGNPAFLTRNLIYTAITRAKQSVILIGEKRVLGAMIRNNRTQRRYSALNERLLCYATVE